MVLNITQERAFVINKIKGDDGSIRWSAPVFMRGSAIGFGCTVGTPETVGGLRPHSQQWASAAGRSVGQPVVPAVNACAEQGQ
jgi:hypothetical protein